MFSQLVPINKDVHAGKKVRPLDSFSFAGNFHLASVMLPEFARAGANYPIVFLEDKEQETFRPVVMLGLEEGNNLFVDADGRWASGYVPAIIRRYPFSLIRTETPDQFLVGIDADSPLLNDTEGNALFNEDGSVGQIMENARQFLGELNQMERLTLDFAKILAVNDLLTPLNMQVQEGGQTRTISGAFMVNEERLNGLSDEVFAQLRKQNFLPGIYAHLLSLAQIDRLLSRKAEADRASAPVAESDNKGSDEKKRSSAGGDTEAA